MADERDIIEKLLDFERCGMTPGTRINLRESAAIEIHRLRQENERYRKALRDILDASNDPYETARAALSAEAAASCNHWPGQKRCGVCGMGSSSLTSKQSS